MKKKKIKSLYGPYRYLYSLHKGNRFVRLKYLRVKNKCKPILTNKFFNSKNFFKKKIFLKKFLSKKKFNLIKKLKKSTLISKKYTDYINFLNSHKNFINYSYFIKYFYYNRKLFNKRLLNSKKKPFTGGLKIFKNLFGLDYKNKKKEKEKEKQVQNKKFISKKLLPTATINSTFNNLKTKSLRLLGNPKLKVISKLQGKKIVNRFNKKLSNIFLKKKKK